MNKASRDASDNSSVDIARESRTARLTLLIDPHKKALFEQLCSQEDVTPSQKVRQFIREYIEQQMAEGASTDSRKDQS